MALSVVITLAARSHGGSHGGSRGAVPWRCPALSLSNIGRDAAAPCYWPCPEGLYANHGKRTNRTSKEKKNININSK